MASATGRPLGVAGPQLGYYYPEIVYQEHLQGPDIHAQGAAVSGARSLHPDRPHAGLRLEPHLGRNDNQDFFLEQLCVPGGSQPTRATQFYSSGPLPSR